MLLCPHLKSSQSSPLYPLLSPSMLCLRSWMIKTSMLMNSAPVNKARLLSASAPHTSSWLSVVPSVGLGVHLDPAEFQAAVKWWLGMNSSVGSVCPFCPDITLDPLGHHAVSCRHGGDVAIRHNHLRNIFTEFCCCAHLSVCVEAGQAF